MKNYKLFVSILLFLCISLSDSLAQEALKQKPSPLGMVTYSMEDAYVKVTYGRPHLRGREVFKKDSELAPTGKLWRTGANEATEITTTKDIVLGGKEIPAGTYSIFTIPGEENWTVVINQAVGQWGAYTYDQDLDLVRFKVPVESVDNSYEPFTIRFEQSGGEVSMQMIWDKTMVSIPIEF